MIHFRLIMVEAFADSYISKHDTFDAAKLYFNRRDSGSIVYAHIAEIDTPKGLTGKIINVTQIKGPTP